MITILWTINDKKYVSPNVFDTPDDAAKFSEEVRKGNPKWQLATAMICRLVPVEQQEEELDI